MNTKMILWMISVPPPPHHTPITMFSVQGNPGVGGEDWARLFADQKHFGRECPLDRSGCPPLPHPLQRDRHPLSKQLNVRPEDHPG